MKRARSESSGSSSDTASSKSNTSSASTTSNNDNLRSNIKSKEQPPTESQSRSENKMNVQQENFLENPFAIDSPIIKHIHILRDYYHLTLFKQQDTMEMLMKQTEMTTKQELMKTRIELKKQMNNHLREMQMDIMKLLEGKTVEIERTIALELVACADTWGHKYNMQKMNTARMCMPIFEGKQNDNVKEWVCQISNIAYIFKLKNFETMIAVLKQLRGFAMLWFKRQPLKERDGWKKLKLLFENHFSNDRAAYIASIKGRFWKIQEEQFIDYAKDKLRLMKGLPQQQQITFLINGIKNLKLRQALRGKFISTDECINYVQKIMSNKVISSYIFEKQKNKNQNADMPQKKQGTTKEQGITKKKQSVKIRRKS